mmetsp:Transcript_16824/g.38749  ORF Transcript_16824/g.38749 Transcript_16824/m.38749 type:complete len:261 (-) Transcript_16824:2482-3264(-)
MLHGTDQGFHQSKGIQRSLPTVQMSLPKIAHGPMGRLKLLDQPTVVCFPHQVGCDESRRTMDLSDLIREHVPVVIMCGHPKATVGPSNQLHGGRIGNQMSEFSAASFQKSFLQKVFLVIFFKHPLHGRPETLLPLEDCFLGHDIGSDFGFEATFEKEVGQLFDIVIGIVVDDSHIVFVSEIPLVDNKGCRAILGDIGCEESSLPNLIPAGTIFSPHCVTFKEDGILISQLDPINVNSISADGNAIPTSSHGTIWRPKALA